MARNDGFFRNIIESAKAQGWKVERTTKGHWRCTPPTAMPLVFTSGTPSDHREVHNFLSQMRRSGYQG